MGGIERVKGSIEDIIKSCDDWLTEYPTAARIITQVNTTLTVAGISYLYFKSNPRPIDVIVYGLSLIFGKLAGDSSHMKRRSLQTLKELNIDYEKIKNKFKTREFVHKKDRTLWEKVKDYALEHPKAGGAIFGLVSTGLILSLSKILKPSNTLFGNPEEIKMIATGIGSLAMAGYYGLKIARNMFHSSLSPHVKKRIKIYFLKLTSQKDKVHREYGILSKETKISVFNEAYATISASKGDFAGAFEATINNYRGKNIQDLLIDSRIKVKQVINSINHNHRLITKHPECYPNYFAIFPVLDSADKRDLGLTYLDKLLKISENNPDIYPNVILSYSLLMGEVGEEERYQEGMLKTLDFFEDDFVKIGKNVFKFKGKGFFEDNVALRKDDLKSLLDEKRHHTFIKTNFDNINTDPEKYKYINPPKITKKNGFGIGVTWFEKEFITLYDYLSENFNPQSLNDASRFLGRTHGANPMTSPLSEEQLLKDITSGIRGMDNYSIRNALKIIIPNLEFLVQGFSKVPTMIYLDNHRFNVLIKGDGETYAGMDKQFKKPNPVGYDLSKLADQGISYPHTSEGDKLRDNDVKVYYEEVSNFHRIMGFDELLYFYLKSSPIKALTLYSYSFDNPRMTEPLNHTFRNAIHSLDRLKSRDEHLSKHDLNIINDLIKGYNALRIVLTSSPSSQ